MSENLLIGTSRIEVPYIKVNIGEYEFGVHTRQQGSKFVFPNFVKSLQVNKINGAVNKYTLSLTYPITQYDDPNYIDKVLSSVANSRAIRFTYGDLSHPNFIYKNEEATIINVSSSFNISASSISYTIIAQSTSTKLQGSISNEIHTTNKKPSDVIKQLLRENRGNILDIFTGMRNKDYWNELIASNDKEVEIEPRININLFDYLKYLVSCMRVDEANSNDVNKGKFYVLNVVDDTTGKYGGTYFKITQIATNQSSMLDTYEIDIGKQTSNIVLDFQLQDTQNYSILYQYYGEANQSSYRQTINDKGEIENFYAPSISSNNLRNNTPSDDITWWTKITQFPIKATLIIKGLLRPAILMSYVKLNIWFYGRKHIASGKYIITSQVDNIDESGSRTTLSLTRISGDNEYIA